MFSYIHYYVVGPLDEQTNKQTNAHLRLDLGKKGAGKLPLFCRPTHSRVLHTAHSLKFIGPVINVHHKFCFVWAGACRVPQSLSVAAPNNSFRNLSSVNKLTCNSAFVFECVLVCGEMWQAYRRNLACFRLKINRHGRSRCWDHLKDSKHHPGFSERINTSPRKWRLSEYEGPNALLQR